MSCRILSLLIIFAIVLMGHLIKRRSIQKYKKKKNTTNAYSNKFIDFANDYMQHCRINQELYSACIQEANSIQEELGRDGVIDQFIDPLKHIRGSNYQLFINVLPEMRTMQDMLDNFIIRNRLNQLLCLCDDALQKHIGNLNHAIELERNGLFNPFHCFGVGIRWLVGLPFDILCWMGLLSPLRNDKVHQSFLFKLVGGVITFIGFASSIITITLGWDSFRTILLRVVSKGSI